MNLRSALITGAAVVAVVAMAASAATLAALGEAVGWHPPLHWALPVSVDVLALVAGVAWLANLPARVRQLGCALTLVSVAASVALNALGHLVDTGHIQPGPGMVIGVSAVPPLAAALAVHLVAVVVAPESAPATAPEGDTAPPEVSPSPTADRVPAVESPQVICGAHLPVPPVPPRPKLDTEEAREVIEACWRDGLSVREAARLSTRSPSQVQRVYARLDEKHGEPIPGQTQIPVAA